jgi:hypothetical protein
MFSNGNGIIDRCAPAKVFRCKTSQERVVDPLSLLFLANKANSSNYIIDLN